MLAIDVSLVFESLDIDGEDTCVVLRIEDCNHVLAFSGHVEGFAHLGPFFLEWWYCQDRLIESR